MVTTMATMAVMSMAIRTAFVWYMLQRKSPHTSVSSCQRAVGRPFPTAPVLDRNFTVPEPKGLEHLQGPGSLSVELAALWRTGGTPDPITAGSPGRTWQSCLSSAPWPASVREKSELSGLPNCPHVLLSLPAHLGSWGAMGAPPRPLASPSPLTKMLSRIIFQGKRLLRMKQEREKLATATMSCAPGPHHPQAAPGRNQS